MKVPAKLHVRLRLRQVTVLAKCHVRLRLSLTDESSGQVSSQVEAKMSDISNF